MNSYDQQKQQAVINFNSLDHAAANSIAHANCLGQVSTGVSFINSSGDTLMQVQDGGKVGIGTTQPGSQLRHNNLELS